MLSVGLNERAEFYLCLARAFLPPLEKWQDEALRDYLAADLSELSTEIAYPIEKPLALLLTQLQGITQEGAYLQLYSRLFLAPPVVAHLNAGLYLDAAVMGRSVIEIEQAYHHYGVAKSPQFYDTPDHLASLLEFTSYLFAMTEDHNAQGQTDKAQASLQLIGEFLHRYVVSWLPRLQSDLIRASVNGDTNPYITLVELLSSATPGAAMGNMSSKESARI